MREPKRKKRREFNLSKKKKRDPLTFSDVLKATVDEVENSFSMMVYDHPTNLSPEQVIFALEFIKNGYKALPAVKETFGNMISEWSDQRCYQLAEKLLGLKKVKKYINEELELRAHKLQITADWIAKKYKQWATINVTDYITVEYTKKPPGSKALNFRPRPQIIMKKSLEEMPEVIKSSIKSIGVTASGDLKVEFIDQKAALDSLTKLMGFANDKIEAEIKGPVILQFDSEDANA